MVELFVSIWNITLPECILKKEILKAFCTKNFQFLGNVRKNRIEKRRTLCSAIKCCPQFFWSIHRIFCKPRVNSSEKAVEEFFFCFNSCLHVQINYFDIICFKHQFICKERSIWSSLPSSCLSKSSTKESAFPSFCSKTRNRIKLKYVLMKK